MFSDEVLNKISPKRTEVTYGLPVQKPNNSVPLVKSNDWAFMQRELCSFRGVCYNPNSRGFYKRGSRFVSFFQTEPDSGENGGRYDMFRKGIAPCGQTRLIKSGLYCMGSESWRRRTEDYPGQKGTVCVLRGE